MQFSRATKIWLLGYAEQRRHTEQKRKPTSGEHSKKYAVEYVWYCNMYI